MCVSNCTKDLCLELAPFEDGMPFILHVLCQPVIDSQQLLLEAIIDRHQIMDFVVFVVQP